MEFENSKALRTPEEKRFIYDLIKKKFPLAWFRLIYNGSSSGMGLRFFNYLCQDLTMNLIIIRT